MSIAAYRERQSWNLNPETGEPGILRDEWRVSLVIDFSEEDLREAFGNYWRDIRKGYSSHVLEHRYIRAGVEEGWNLFDLAKSHREVLEMIDTHAVAVDPELIAIQAERKAQAEEQERKASEECRAHMAAQERQYHRDLSEAAFRRLANGKDRAWTERYNLFIERALADKAILGAIEQDRTEYDAVMAAETVPGKRKAIKAFLAKWERRAVAA